ncbi:MAG: hypothetical protein HYW57_05305 [Ignavibacteriales bacterium]|nr:hypothetical protein [Ignavibacteriales bacterium]
MPDNLLLLVFGVLSTLALTVGGFSFYMAVRYAKKPDGEMKMVAWALVGLELGVFCDSDFGQYVVLAGC